MIVSKNMAKHSSSSRNMTKGKFPRPKAWLSIEICESAYNELRKQPVVNDPLPEFNTRVPGRLESLLGSVSQECFGELVHPTLSDAAAAYFVSCIKGHPLPNGNKRMGILFTNLFLFLNGYELNMNRLKIYSLSILVAEEKSSYDELKLGIAELFKEHIIKRKTDSRLSRFFDRILRLARRK